VTIFSHFLSKESPQKALKRMLFEKEKFYATRGGYWGGLQDNYTKYHMKVGYGLKTAKKVLHFI